MNQSTGRVGRKNFIGLVMRPVDRRRAFFYAGARALLISNWPVETTSAKALTTDIFRRQAEDPTLTRAQALRRAMLGLMDGPGYVDEEGRSVFSYAHPIFWAPFSLVGDGGGGKPAS